ncbi:thiamine biosynthesis protein ThiS [Spiribacter halobius]|uniref:Thiamine biosynthesis protein ThiS n=1 Tax=Sediminicurvatus halobius TaxID=2182432 RepID=A0A2U2N245_9GAMM|nr:thiamine biosynthesis protein ThiS [Spiribacter halobius]
MEPKAAEIEILLNGEPYRLPPGACVGDLLETLELAGRRVAIELNEEVLPRSEHASHPLQPGDRVEVVRAIGGG